MRFIGLGVLVLASFFLQSTMCEAKPGKGKGGGKAFKQQSKAFKQSRNVEVFEARDLRRSDLLERRRLRSEAAFDDDRFVGNTRFSESFPRGNAWGLRRRLDLPVTRVGNGVLGSPIDGQIIRRAGRSWEYDGSRSRWILED